MLPSPRLRVLVTAGPTREPIDAVRYISNRSSGRMGIALADAAAARGHAVTLLLGAGSMPAVPRPAALNPTKAREAASGSLADAPAAGEIRTERFETTADLAGLLDRLWPLHDLLIMAAAVSDHRPAVDEAALAASEGKLKRGDGPLLLRLEPTPDLLAGLAAKARPDQTLIGFALEPLARLQQAAQDKLRRKGLHGIVANPLETMDSTTIDGTLLLADGRSLSPQGGRLSKERFAQWLVDEVIRLRQSRSAP